MRAVPYKQFVREIMEIYAPRRKKTRSKMRQVLREFGRLGYVRTTGDLRPVHVARWMHRHAGRSTATVHSLLRSFRAACNIAIESGWMLKCPIGKMSHWVSPPKPGQTHDHRTADEITRFLAQLDTEAANNDWRPGRTRALGYTYAYTGMRKQEALGLRWSDVDLDKHIINITSHAARPLKTADSAAPIGMHAELVAVLTQWRDRCRHDQERHIRRSPYVFPSISGIGKGYWDGGYPGTKPLEMIRDVGARAGVPRLTIACFRKTIGTFARKWGITPGELQQWLRHTKAETQRYYTEDDTATMHEALNATARKISFKIATGT